MVDLNDNESHWAQSTVQINKLSEKITVCKACDRTRITLLKSRMLLIVSYFSDYNTVPDHMRAEEDKNKSQVIFHS